MILGNIYHISRYEGLGQNLNIGLRFLVEQNLSSLPDGRVPIVGEEVYAVLSTYETRPETHRPETHQAYIDIQHLIEGSELIGVAPAEEMEALVAEHPENDLWFHSGATEKLLLEGARFLIFWPEDAHEPCISVGSAQKVRKCLIKVKV